MNPKLVLLILAFAIAATGCSQIKGGTAPSAPSGFKQIAALGTIDGGGGKGVFCQETKPTIEALEVYEAKNVFHLQD